MRYNVLVAPLLAIAIVSAVGCRTAPIVNVTDAPLAVPPGSRVTMEGVARAIWIAGQKHGWKMDEVRPGEITGTLTERQHVAVVAIIYDTSKFSINYKDSKNLLHEGDSIHRRYNHWIQTLETEIKGEVAELATTKK